MKIIGISPAKKGSRYKFEIEIEDCGDIPLVEADELLDVDKLRLAILEQTGRYFECSTSSYNWKDEVRKYIDSYWVKNSSPKKTECTIEELPSDLAFDKEPFDSTHHQVVS